MTALGDHTAVLGLEPAALDQLAGQQLRVAGLDDRHAAQHLPDDDLDVLVVDRHALRVVDLLHFADQVDLDRALAEDAQHVVRVGGTHGQLLADLDVVALAAPADGRAWRSGRRSRRLPSSGVTTSFLVFSVSSIRTRPAASEIGATPLGVRASKSSTTRGRPCVMSSPATPPVWKVRIVSWVPGSPMDWAAMMPTASPMSTSLPVASERP